MTQIDLEDWLTSLSGDTPASPSRLPGSDEAIKMTDTSGRKCLELSKLSGRLGSLEKMLLDTSLWASTRCYLTWKPKDTKQGALLFRLSPQMPDIDATDAGLWATPNSMDHLPQRSEESLKKMAEGHRKGRALPSNLREQVDPETVRKWQEAQEPKLWATPTAVQRRNRALDLVENNSTVRRRGSGQKRGIELPTQVKMYPTPAARDYKGMSGKGRQERKGNPKDTLPNAVGGSLNPQWVEWLMGYPVGYTDLNN